MTEVRSVLGAGLGLFATKDYETGDVILAEALPLIRLAPVSRDDEQELMVALQLQKKGQPKRDNDNVPQLSLLDLIEVPESVIDTAATRSPSVDADGDRGNKFKAMVQAALCFLVQYSNSKDTDSSAHSDKKVTIDRLLELYHPPLLLDDDPSNNCEGNYEREIVRLSRLAIDYLIAKTINRPQPTSAPTAEERTTKLQAFLMEKENTGLFLMLQKVMLIWACNAFAGGRVYDQFSRVNHSCDPNAVVAVGVSSPGIDKNDYDNNNDAQTLLAAAPIRAGDEVTLSYLHSGLLYADVVTRRNALLRDKSFACACPRCEMKGQQQQYHRDLAQQVPCPVCHPRMASPSSSSSVQLPEDVQYDDEQNVHYVCPSKVSVPAPISIAADSGGGDGKTTTAAAAAAIFDVTCDACGFHYQEGDGENSTGRDSESIKQTSEKYEKLFQTNRTVVDKVVAFLAQHHADQHHYEATTKSKSRVVDPHRDDDDDDETALIRTERLEQHLSMASSVLGAKHWATNLVMLLQLDQTLAAFHARILLTGQQKNGNDEDDDDDDEKLETIAEAIDMLERIVRFVEGLGLKLHMGHLLSGVIIGTARALVSLGDVKSQKYAADWLDKIDADYVAKKFEPEGIVRVVQTLQVAWRRTQVEQAGDSANRGSSSSSISRPEKRSKQG